MRNPQYRIFITSPRLILGDGLTPNNRLGVHYLEIRNPQYGIFITSPRLILGDGWTPNNRLGVQYLEIRNPQYRIFITSPRLMGRAERLKEERLRTRWRFLGNLNWSQELLLQWCNNIRLSYDTTLLFFPRLYEVTHRIKSTFFRKTLTIHVFWCWSKYSANSTRVLDYRYIKLI